MKSILIYLLVLCLALVNSSCGLEKRIVYFNNQSNTNNKDVVLSPSEAPVLSEGDVITVKITALDEMALKPFLPSIMTNESGLVSDHVHRFVINRDNIITFPILGDIKVGGYNTYEASLVLRRALSQYIINPIVEIELVNFKVTILGEVKQPGVYTVPGSKITILELLGMAGDLTVYGQRKNIKVIRIVKGHKKSFNIDLTSDKVFTSNVFYLHKNDVVYVPPNKAQMTRSIFSPLVSTFVSVLTLTITILNFTR